MISARGTRLNPDLPSVGFGDVYYFTPGESVSFSVRSESTLRYTHCPVGGSDPQIPVAIFSQSPNPGIGQRFGAHVRSNVVSALIDVQQLAQTTLGSYPKAAVRRLEQ